MSMQFANVWERVADTVGDEIALINGIKNPIGLLLILKQPRSQQY